jgi:hypothetical protein
MGSALGWTTNLSTPISAAFSISEVYSFMEFSRSSGFKEAMSMILNGQKGK